MVDCPIPEIIPLCLVVTRLTRLDLFPPLLIHPADTDHITAHCESSECLTRLSRSVDILHIHHSEEGDYSREDAHPHEPLDCAKFPPEGL